ncbi:MAG TPA: bifunctional riboflavin kinase/FAD synthetase [Cytophagales bacterium]|nr:bifunctional riboflavin kinase/FAD synthetase [Cytophagales bacterium]
MQIHSDVNNFPEVSYAIVTSGTFDGVHVGHQKILERLHETAKELKGESVVITFWPHPRYVLSNIENELKLLSTIDEKIELLDKNKVDHLIIIPFTKEFSQMTSEQFIQEILIRKIRTKKLVIGYDHRFGKNREGSFDYLKENEVKYGFAIEEIPEEDVHNIAVSSTKIRNALLGGEVEIANEFLGRYYSLRGTVMEGDKIGRKLGYPTANIYLKENYKLIPGDGIYAGLISVKNKKYKGLIYIGERPTIEGTKRNIEAFIFDFKENIYGESIEVSFIKFIRGDMKFDNLEELKIQIKKDEESGHVILDSISL